MDQDTKQTLESLKADQATKFGRLKQTVELTLQAYKDSAIERDKALHQKIDAYKWGLILIATVAAICVAGLVTLAVGLGRGI